MLDFKLSITDFQLYVSVGGNSEELRELVNS